MPEPKTDRSAMGLLKRVAKYAHEDRATTPGTTRLARALAQLPTAARHARNIDKQRRRLLAEVCQLRADSMAVVPGEAVTIARIKHGLDYWTAVDLVIAAQGKRAAKLRTIAARLRGTK
jgi:hypothetical protein